MRNTLFITGLLILWNLINTNSALAGEATFTFTAPSPLADSVVNFDFTKPDGSKYLIPSIVI